MNIYSRYKAWWAGFRWKKTLLLILIALILFFLVSAIVRSRRSAPEVAADPRPQVEVTSFQELADGAKVERTATLDVAGSAPLIARTGGRVTNIFADVSGEVKTGQLIIEIDGGSEPNVAGAQAAGASRSLAIFNDIEKQALAAADNGIEIAELSLDAATAGRSLTSKLQSQVVGSAKKGVEQAEVQVRVTSDTKDAAVGTNDLNTLIEAANVGVEAAKLAREQAAIAATLTNRQTSDALQQARRAVTNAQIGKQRAIADLTSQRILLETQSSVAAEQIRTSQVIAPFSGTVTSLAVQVGDFLAPGQQVGEIIGASSGILRVNIPAGVATSLTTGQEVPVTTNQSTYTGVVTATSSLPSAATLLYQVDIAVKEDIIAGDLFQIATIKLPVSATKTSTALIPLDAINIRQSGPVIFTVGEDGIAAEHTLDIIDYHSDFAEARIVFSNSTLIITKGNRTLSSGDEVAIAS